MVSDKFRRDLRKEASLWQAEGLIDRAVYEQLAERYQFDSLESVASHLFVTILLGLGGILMGLGAIAFVAANWQEWSPGMKLMLLLGFCVGANGAGFYLWRSPMEKRQRLGQGLLLLGALILGALLGQISQMFHQSGPFYQLLLIWGLGVLAMAYSLRMTSLGVMAVLLVAWGYFMGVNELFSTQEFFWLQLLLEHMPLLAGLLLVPLAYWCRSRVIFVLAALTLIPALFFNSVAFPTIWMVAIACVLPPAILWGYDDLLWPKVDSRSFRFLARAIGIIYLSIVFYLCSFNWFWQDFSLSASGNNRVWLLLDVAIFSAIALWEWWQMARPSSRHPHRWGFDLTTSVMAGLIVVTASVFLWQDSSIFVPELATFIFNLQLFLLAAGLIRVGLLRGGRGSFWGGIVLLTLQIISRMLEYNTELLLKSLVLVLCGVGVIAAGLWFERHLSTVKPSEED
ncbi:MAG: DUF2157 domain-containing protein [Hormoscilla sp. GM7CHS1pb]|nr:DUF2157 domain-containing protein [Hormoscilla sp. GM7CHS1pb]